MKYKYRAQKDLADLLLGYFADKADVYMSDKMISNLVRQKNNIHEGILKECSNEKIRDEAQWEFENNIESIIDIDLKEDLIRDLSELIKNDQTIPTKKKEEFSTDLNSIGLKCLFDIFMYSIKRENRKREEKCEDTNPFCLSFKNLKGIKAVYYFTGRDKYLCSIKYNVNIAGVGGIGKSELCRRIIENADFDVVYWFEGENLSQFLLDNVITTQKEFFYFSREKKLKIIISYLCGLSKNALLVFDNVTRDTKELSWISKELNCCFLITARSKMDCVENVNINALQMEECLQLMYRLSDRRTEEDRIYLKKIIQLSGKHTLAIEFISKTLAKSPLSTREFYEYLVNTGYDLSFIENKIQYGYAKEGMLNLQIAEHIEKIFSLKKMDEKEQLYLSNIAILPSINLKISLVNKLCMENCECGKFIEEGWLEKHGETMVYLHNIIGQAILLQATKANIKNNSISFLIKTLSSEIEYKGTKKEKELVIYSLLAGSVVENIQQENSDVKTVDFLRKLAELEYRLGRHTNSVRIQEIALDLSEKLGFSDKTVFKMKKEQAFYLKNTGDYKKAEEILYISIKGMRDRFQENDNPDLAEALGDLAFIKQLQGNTGAALKYQKECLRISIKSLASDDINLGYAYGKMATILQGIGGKQNLDKALLYRKKANDIFRKSGAKTDYAYGLNNLALLYLDEHQYKKATEIQIAALKILKNQLSGIHPELGITYANLALICAKMEKVFWANLFVNEAYQIWSKYFDEENLACAKIYYIVAECKYLNSDISEAMRFCDLSISIYRKKGTENNRKLYEALKLRQEIESAEKLYTNNSVRSPS